MKNTAKWLYLTLIYGFLYTPIFVLMIYSFNDSRYSIIWRGVTTRWYQELWQDSELLTTAWHSILLGVSASLIACIIGTLASLALYRYRFFGRKLLHGLIFVMILAPDIIIGIALLIFFNFSHVQLGFFSLLLAHITFCIPFVTVTVSSQLERIDPILFEAATDLGATDSQLFAKIFLPLLWPAMLGSALLAFTLSFDDVVISYFVSGPDFEILPLKIYSMVRLGLDPEVNALSSFIFAVTLITVLTSQFLLRRKP